MPDKARPAQRAPTTEEELRTATVGELQPLSGPIVLADYDPNWPAQFEREAERVRAVLGDRVLRIEHVGSTSIPGLAAKPIIDVLLVVQDATDEGAFVPALEAAGYRLRIREDQHRMLKGPDTDVNLHVFSAGHPEIDRMLLFRDRLRAVPADRELYLRTKRELARRRWRYVQHYADAKTAVVQEILARAGTRTDTTDR
jgi:GrpB-like predicted nucleotidyltransferase (UPF0157 family)